VRTAEFICDSHHGLRNFPFWDKSMRPRFARTSPNAVVGVSVPSHTDSAVRAREEFLDRGDCDDVGAANLAMNLLLDKQQEIVASFATVGRD
jgi:hypothetical protein